MKRIGWSLVAVIIGIIAFALVFIACLVIVAPVALLIEYLLSGPPGRAVMVLTWICCGLFASYTVGTEIIKSFRIKP